MAIPLIMDLRGIRINAMSTSNPQYDSHSILSILKSTHSPSNLHLAPLRRSICSSLLLNYAQTGHGGVLTPCQK